jgi:hypothetical protein
MNDTYSASSSSSSSGPDGAVRTQSWSCDGPAELDLDIEVGRVDITLTENVRTVELELRAEPPRGGWQQNLSGFLDWVGDVTGQDASRFTRSFTGTFGSGGVVGSGNRVSGGDLASGLSELFGGFDPGRLGAEAPAEAVQATEVTWTDGGRRLTVRSPGAMPLRVVPLLVSVRAPAGSRLALRTGAGDITVTGRCGDAGARTGSGNLRLGSVDGDADLVTGSGTVDTGSIRGRTRARTGSGDLSLGPLAGPGELKAGSGTVRLAGVRADLRAKTGSGNLLIDDAEAGRLDLTTGSGDLRVRIHAGVTAELDLQSRSGRVRSELDVRSEAPADTAPLVVHGRTGSGDVLVARAG